jgi:hypothetical protein
LSWACRAGYPARDQKFKSQVIGPTYRLISDGTNPNPLFLYSKTRILPFLAINDGSKVLGYTVWSIMDNFEWSYGYIVKYGIHHVDFNDPERKRTPKASSHWYKDVIAKGYVEKC